MYILHVNIYICVCVCVLCFFLALEPFSVLVLFLEVLSRVMEVFEMCSFEVIKQSFGKAWSCTGSRVITPVTSSWITHHARDEEERKRNFAQE